MAEDSPRMMAAAASLVCGSGGAWKTRGMTLLSRKKGTLHSCLFGLRDLVDHQTRAMHFPFRDAGKSVKSSLALPDPERERERDIGTSTSRLSLKLPRPTTPSYPFFSCRASWQRHTPPRNTMGILGTFRKVSKDGIDVSQHQQFLY